MRREEYNYWLANIHKVGIKKIDCLLQSFSSAEGVYHAPEEELKKFVYSAENERTFGKDDVYHICSGRDEEIIHSDYTKLQKRGIYFVSKEDEHYPEKLRNIYDPPFALYYKGSLPDKDDLLLAVIGARECTPYGREMAKQFAAQIGAKGIRIISGLARGVDSYAHEGALGAGGITYGILGCGIDICYPKENIGLYMDMQSKGGVISEYPPGIKPFQGNFPMRNRIISGLSDGILVIEAREKSGSLITVDYGLEQGKDIYALPGKVCDRLSAGCNNLIKMGAKLVTSPKDILEDLIPNYQAVTAEGKKNNKFLETNGKIVYACLSLEPMHIEKIALRTGLSVDLLMEQLLILELGGLITQMAGNYYIAIDKD